MLLCRRLGGSTALLRQLAALVWPEHKHSFPVIPSLAYQAVLCCATDLMQHYPDPRAARTLLRGLRRLSLQDDLVLWLSLQSAWWVGRIPLLD